MMVIMFRIASILFLLFFLVPTVHAQEANFSGFVTRVDSGDTIRVMKSGRPILVHLAGILAPNFRQLYGRRARKEMRDSVFGMIVEIHILGRDGRRHIIGEVILGDGTNLSEKLIKNGFVRWNAQRKGSDSLKDMENEARSQRRGLWSHSPAP